jgi:hypothetical protein
VSRLNWNDPDEVRRVILDLRVAADDIDGIVVDMLAPTRLRSLGPVLHRRHYADARYTLVQLLAFAPSPSDGGKGGDHGGPSGNGDAGPTH